MAVIKNKKGQELYTNSEYYDKHKSDNMVIGALVSSIVIGIIFYTMFYPFFISSEIEYFPHFGSIIVFIICTVLLYKAKKESLFFTNRVLSLPLILIVYLSTCIYIQANNNKFFGKETFSTYINNNVIKTQKVKYYVDEVKSSIDKYFNIEEI